MCGISALLFDAEGRRLSSRSTSWPADPARSAGDVRPTSCGRDREVLAVSLSFRAANASRAATQLCSRSARSSSTRVSGSSTVETRWPPGRPFAGAWEMHKPPMLPAASGFDEGRVFRSRHALSFLWIERATPAPRKARTTRPRNAKPAIGASGRSKSARERIRSLQDGDPPESRPRRASGLRKGAAAGPCRVDV